MRYGTVDVVVETQFQTQRKVAATGGGGGGAQLSASAGGANNAMVDSHNGVGVVKQKKQTSTSDNTSGVGATAPETDCCNVHRMSMMEARPATLLVINNVDLFYGASTLPFFQQIN